MNVINEVTYTKNWPSNYGNPEWLLHDRFGLFIHWGLYSNAARHEWVMKHEKIHPDKYKKYFKYFNPDLYNPKDWARAAKNAGMKYFVITTKHHEGFALWDSKLTNYKVTNTPAKRDLLLEMVNAFREEGLKVGFYHSLIDWHHPEFPIDGVHPQSDDEEYKKEALNRDMKNYAEYLHGQVRELLTDYGKIDYLWFDFSYANRNWGWSTGKGKNDWQSEKLEKMILDLQPDIILNDRLDLGRGVVTPEQYQPREAMTEDGEPVIWEACQTLNGSWGYDRDNLDYKSGDMLIKMLIDSVSKGGNLLLNVGPNGRGEMDQRSLNSLSEIGEWMRVNARSIYGAKNSEYTAPIDCRYTQKGNSLYLHIFSWPFKHIHLDGLAGKIDYAQMLHDGSEIFYKEHDPDKEHTHMSTTIRPGSVILELPVQKPNIIVPVVEVFLKN
ncbi:alpha-L-fucosidase [Lederbergia lenta]|uniref:alpha-L-fucosidase n=1 Tax=Lederbergia lenta TaxID=1467 RepID=A0A2X4VNV1_LEDLE|nr:alpha-L-fucosidase [Lederbergia lenta]MCM3110884.1 alpha-L-fucosidase [Lederbergia lenta]MEC2325720.1 alpha-L-fucosidase [Lederbergia lenta]SQI53867.1 Alpha-L-fucosidase [Lederbergia lenta]